ncbi:hypothetical protein PAMP_008278 [Pampus punctatissimus]
MKARLCSLWSLVVSLNVVSGRESTAHSQGGGGGPHRSVTPLNKISKADQSQMSTGKERMKRLKRGRGGEALDLWAGKERCCHCMTTPARKIQGEAAPPQQGLTAATNRHPLPPFAVLECVKPFEAPLD